MTIKVRFGGRSGYLLDEGRGRGESSSTFVVGSFSCHFDFCLILILGFILDFTRCKEWKLDDDE
jgi:hypothetical protein